MFGNLNSKAFKVLNLFLDNPEKSFHLREIARLLKIAPATSKAALDELKKAGLIIEQRVANLRLFSADRENESFRQLKRLKNIEWLKNKKFLKRIMDENAISVVLFGSYAIGTNTKESDMDLLILVKTRAPIKIKEFNGIELQIIQKTPAELRELEKSNNSFYREIISTGIALYGRMPA